METQARENPAVSLLHERMEGDLTLIGLTGGIACGKSTVSGMIRERGIPVIDADQIARDVVRPGEPAYGRIVERFGRGILSDDRTIDREKLGAIVFSDEGKRSLLEAVTHPRIFHAIVEEVRRLRRERKPKAVVVDAALLFESGLADGMDWNVVVSVPEEIQIPRLMARDGVAEDEARRRVAAQMPASEKTERARYVIDNSGSLEATRAQVAMAFSSF
jgi:dephospho-CoA kinase